jgi:hypothetical protein
MLKIIMLPLVAILAYPFVSISLYENQSRATIFIFIFSLKNKKAYSLPISQLNLCLRDAHKVAFLD